ARGFDRHDHSIHEKREPKLVNAEGNAMCENETHQSPDDCELKFIRLSDREEFEIVDSPALLKAHMQDHNKKLKASLKGKIVLSAIFHDDHLRVSDFEILAAEDSLPKDLLTESKGVKTIQIFDRRHSLRK